MSSKAQAAKAKAKEAKDEEIRSDEERSEDDEEMNSDDLAFIDDKSEEFNEEVEDELAKVLLGFRKGKYRD